MKELKKIVYEQLEKTNSIVKFEVADIVADICERAVGSCEDMSDNEILDNIFYAIDEELIYTTDQWEVYRFYCDMGDDKSLMYERLYDDIYAIIKKCSYL